MGSGPEEGAIRDGMVLASGEGWTVRLRPTFFGSRVEMCVSESAESGSGLAFGTASRRPMVVRNYSSSCTTEMGEQCAKPGCRLIAPADSRHDGAHDKVLVSSLRRDRVASDQIGAAVFATFIVSGSSVGVCDFPATHASIMSAHSCSM